MPNHSHGCTRSRRLWTLGLLLLIAAGLIWSLPDHVGARSMFQSSPPELPEDTPTPTPTLEEPNVPLESDTPAVTQPGEEINATATFYVAPEAAETPTPAAPETPTSEVATAVPGYLPPPTLTSPGAFPPSAMLTLRGTDTAAAQTQPPTPAPTATPPPTFAAQLIDNSVLVLGYLWLGCGGLLMIAASGVIFWLWRRGRGRVSG